MVPGQGPCLHACLPFSPRREAQESPACPRLFPTSHNPQIPWSHREPPFAGVDTKLGPKPGRSAKAGPPRAQVSGAWDGPPVSQVPGARQGGRKQFQQLPSPASHRPSKSWGQRAQRGEPWEPRRSRRKSRHCPAPHSTAGMGSPPSSLGCSADIVPSSRRAQLPPPTSPRPQSPPQKAAPRNERGGGSCLQSRAPTAPPQHSLEASH